MMKVLDLFSGIGGFSLGLERTGGFETVAFCEIDPFCQKILNKHWPDVPIFDDVRELNYEGSVDLICGGYPCQPFSFAGKRKGKEDDRHLWPAMFSLIKKHRPRWVVGENVAGHINMGLDEVLADLEGQNYECRTFVIPACAINAPHRRDRVWIVARNTKGARKTQKQGVCEGKNSNTLGICQAVADTTSFKLNGREDGEYSQEREIQWQVRRENFSKSSPNSEKSQCDGGEHYPCTSKGQVSQSRTASGESSVANSMCKQDKRDNERRFLDEPSRSREDVCDASIKGFPNWSGGEVEQPRPITEFERPDGREIERDFRGVAHGVSRRVDRLKALGNAVVPQIPEIIGHAILQAEATA